MSGEEEPTNATEQQTVVVNSSHIGRIEEFVPGSDWKHYVERMEMFFEVNNVLEEKKVPTILTLMGNKMYALLRSIVSPRRPKELSFAEIVDNLAKHLDPKPIVIAERFKFHKVEQQESESIRDFLARLKKLAETCEIGGYREEAIQDRFVWFKGANDSTQVTRGSGLNFTDSCQEGVCCGIDQKGDHCIAWRKCGRSEKSGSYVSRVFPLWKS